MTAGTEAGTGGVGDGVGGGSGGGDDAGEGDSEGAAAAGGVYLMGQRLTFGWAKGRPADKLSTHDTDCWFCLSSPSVKVG